VVNTEGPSKQPAASAPKPPAHRPAQPRPSLRRRRRTRCARLFTPGLKADEIKRIATVGPLRGILAAASDKRSPAQQEALYEHYLTTRDPEYQALHQTVATLETEKAEIQARSPITHIQQEKTDSPAMANILMRGQYDQVGEQVDPPPPPPPCTRLKKAAPPTASASLNGSTTPPIH
jgi:hypothetical protein